MFFDTDAQRIKKSLEITNKNLRRAINNALQHGFKQTQKETLKICFKRQDDLLAVSIAEDGKCVSPEVAEYLFYPFVTTGRSKKYTGLGIHLVYQWVYKLMSRRIAVMPGENKGTRFTVFIPRPKRKTHQETS